MKEILCDPYGKVLTLTTEEIIGLHNLLCDNYQLLPGMEPISPSGVKSEDMLHSAISRQLVGSGTYFKYADIFSNCATLVFGIVKNHAFYNGNKRMGFLAMIKHLYSNGYVLKTAIKHEEVYELLRCLAGNELILHAISYNQAFLKKYKLSRNSSATWSDEIQVKYLSYWLKQNTEHKNTKIKRKTIPINDFTRILKTKNLEVNFTGRFLHVERKIPVFQQLLGAKGRKADYIIKDSNNISLNLVDQIRKEFGLTFQDGVDNSAFYNEDDILTEEIKSYKKIIYKLART